MQLPCGRGRLGGPGRLLSRGSRGPVRARINAYGSSDHGFAAERYVEWTAIACGEGYRARVDVRQRRAIHLLAGPCKHDCRNLQRPSGPHFAGNFLKYGGHWNNLPVDSHELMALIAPRPLFVTGGTTDRWADPRGEFLATVAASLMVRALMNMHGKGLLPQRISPQPGRIQPEGQDVVLAPGAACNRLPPPAETAAPEDRRLKTVSDFTCGRQKTNWM